MACMQDAWSAGWLLDGGQLHARLGADEVPGVDGDIFMEASHGMVHHLGQHAQLIVGR